MKQINVKEIKEQIKKYMKERDLRMRKEFQSTLIVRIIQAIDKREITYKNGNKIRYARLPLITNVINETLNECTNDNWIKVLE